MQISTLPRGLVSPGSACILAAVPVEWVTAFPRPNPNTLNLTTDITLAPGRTWLRLILASRKRTLRHTLNRSAPGTTYPATINGNTVGTSNYLHHQLYLHSTRRWVILYTEAGSGIAYVIGTPQAGALLTYDYNNDNATQSKITIQYTGTAPLPVYQGTYTLDNSVTVTPGGGSIMDVAFYTATGTESPPTDFTMPALAGRTILWVSRPMAMKDLQPVSGTPTNEYQIQWDPTAAKFRVFADHPLNESEQFTIIYR